MTLTIFWIVVAAFVFAALILDEPIFIENKIWPRFNFVGLSFFPFIFLRIDRDVDEPLIRHEMIHWYRTKKFLAIPWFLFYGANFLFNVFRYKFDFYEAYRNGYEEIVARDNANNEDYLPDHLEVLVKEQAKKI